MSQSTVDSSPLSSPPDSPSPSSPTRAVSSLPGASTTSAENPRAGSNSTTAIEATIEPVPTTATEAAIEPVSRTATEEAVEPVSTTTPEAASESDSPDRTATSNMTAKRASPPSSKRSRDDGDDDVEDSPPPKNTAKSKARSKVKAKPTTKKASVPRTPAARKPAPKKPAPAPSTRPSRNRKAPERFEDITDTPLTPALPSKKPTSKVFDPTYITTNANSRLVKADIFHMLLFPSAWDSLSATQQTTLLAMLPPSNANSALMARVAAGETMDTRPDAFTVSNDCFRTDVAKFKQDLGNGHLAKTWQVGAEQAVIERAAGVFDEWKAAEAELWWGQKADAK